MVEGDALPILGQALPRTGSGAGQWWQVKSAAGPAWLFGDYVRAAGPLDGVPVVEATAESSTAEFSPPAASPPGVDASQNVAPDEAPNQAVARNKAETANQVESAGASPAFSIFSLRPARGSR